MKLFTDDIGRVYALDGPPPAGSPFIGGIAFHPDGRVYTASAQPTDVFIGGWRVSVLGELVGADGGALKQPYFYNAGMPQSNGASAIVPTNVYPNPNLAGGSDITADVYATLPTNHVATAFTGNPANATYLGEGNPAYLFQGTGNSRFMLGVNVNTATNRGVTLPGGRTYRFSAEVQLINSDGLSTRLINAAAPAAGAILTQDGATVIPNGTWQSVFIDFALPTIAANIQLRHGIGMFNAVTPVGATQQTRNLSITDIGPVPLLVDDFTDADDTLLINHVPNIGPQAYQFGVDTSPKIVGNAVFSTIAGRQICGYDVGQVNKKITFTIIGVGNIVVWRLRVDMAAVDQNHVYLSRAAAGALLIVKIEAGVAVTLASVNTPFVSGEQIVVTDDGTTITASINGGTPIVGVTTFLNTLTTMGLQVNGTNTSIDSLRIETPPVVDSSPGGEMIRQVDVTPVEGDPYVAGVRVGPIGGMYQTTTGPVPIFGFSNGFSNGFGGTP